MKKFLAMLLCTAVAFCSFGCGGDDDDSTVTTLYIPYSSGGIGYEWITGPAQRFYDYTVANNISFKEGKVGVKVEAIPSDVTSYGTMGSLPYDIISYDRIGTTKELAAQSLIVNIDDLMNEPNEYDVIDPATGLGKVPADKMDPAFESWFQNSLGEYYSIPYIEYYGGLTYDAETFDNNNLYISYCRPCTHNHAPEAEVPVYCPNQNFYTDGSVEVDQDADGYIYHSNKFGVDICFSSDPDIVSYSTGPNGYTGDYDDGLPSSVIELLALGDFMKEELSLPLLSLSGNFLNYANMFLGGLLHSLMGQDNGYSIMSFDTQGREVDVIVGWSGENLYPGITYLKKPITKRVAITEATGYYTTWLAAKYYAAAILQIADVEGWFAAGRSDENCTHILIQRNFIYGNYSSTNNQQACAFLIEGSFWNNESRIRNNYSDFYRDYNYVEERDLRWCPLPVTIDIPVTGRIVSTEDVTGIPGSYDYDEYLAGNAGQDPTLLDVTRSYLVINANIENNPEKLNAAKAFFKFWMTDAELTYFTLESGCFKPMIYDIDMDVVQGTNSGVSYESYWNGFMQSLWNVKQNGRVIYHAGANATFNKAGLLMQRGYQCGQFGSTEFRSWMNQWDATKGKDNEMDAQDMFQTLMKTKNDWAGIYAGSASDVVYGKDANNEEVIYRNGSFTA